jgi:negative regulator of genetic competence, sporulation and motility
MENQINPLIIVKPNFIENIAENEQLLYADTDSAYLLYNLPFNKFQDIYQLVSYIQGLARELGKLYNESLNYYGTFANLDPEYNTMDFKSEVVAYRGFLGGKKFYGLAKCLKKVV